MFTVHKRNLNTRYAPEGAHLKNISIVITIFEIFVERSGSYDQQCVGF